MITLKKLALAAGLCAVGTLAAQSALAQTTDAYHTIQVFPVVVDTASFAQRFTFRNPNSTTITILPSYYPGTGTAQATALGCPAFAIPANSDRTFNSLRDICGALALGSNFGFLYTYEVNVTNMPYAGFSRVSNPQGNGFSVEAFPANTFTSATGVVSGIRRLAASGGNPQFSTNCFVANLVDMAPAGTPESTDVLVEVFDSAGAPIGSTSVALVPGKLTRLLDVFSAAGAPLGNYDNARVSFFESGAGEPAIMAFCTVQDHTSFGADFRIAKQEDWGDNGIGWSDTTLGAKDDNAMRNLIRESDVRMALGVGTFVDRPFQIAAGGASANTHVVYFRHPDWVSCEIIDPATGLRAAENYGLEMRMMPTTA